MSLSSFIETHREQILEAWEKDASGRIPREEQTRFASLRDHLGELLEAIADDIDVADRTDHPAAEQRSRRDAWAHVAAVAERHGARRAHQGISLKQMVPEFPA
ncbi:MAG: RsbRD N-terminal domain-containing protein, partial [bacterium]